MNTLDQKRIEKLAGEILQSIRANYLAGPNSRDRVYEALNALAVSTASVIHGCQDTEGDPLEFFSSALNIHLEHFAEGGG